MSLEVAESYASHAVTNRNVLSGVGVDACHDRNSLSSMLPVSGTDEMSDAKKNLRNLVHCRSYIELMS